ncbi:hypothetical protein BHE74_00006019 [Ensete ventricosum]|nr:hypothetical protein BHE74_00006019 [Ensete ventricosum]
MTRERNKNSSGYCLPWSSLQGRALQPRIGLSFVNGQAEGTRKQPPRSPPPLLSLLLSPPPQDSLPLDKNVVFLITRIRRYVYHDVVRLQDLDKLIDCSSVQVDYISRQGKDFSPYLRTCQSLQLNPGLIMAQEADVGGDDGNETTRSTVVQGEDDARCSSESENFSMPYVSFIRKKRSGLLPTHCSRSANRMSHDGIAASTSRRKGIPQRSPLC